MTKGFYIDLGANHPVHSSATKMFDDLGWDGVTVEPNPLFSEAFAELRKHGRHLEAAVSDASGKRTFYLVENDPALSTLDEDQANTYRRRGFLVREKSVQVTTLREICELYVEEAPIDFLKIDVEGFEAEVLRGADFTRWRPTIVVVEAVRPYSSIQTHKGWEKILLSHDYSEVLFDGVNRFYLAAERADLKDVISYPACILDKYISHEECLLADYRRFGRTALAAAKCVQVIIGLLRPSSS